MIDVIRMDCAGQMQNGTVDNVTVKTNGWKKNNLDLAEEGNPGGK